LLFDLRQSFAVGRLGDASGCGSEKMQKREPGAIAFENDIDLITDVGEHRLTGIFAHP